MSKQAIQRLMMVLNSRDHVQMREAIQATLIEVEAIPDPAWCYECGREKSDCACEVAA